MYDILHLYKLLQERDVVVLDFPPISHLTKCTIDGFPSSVAVPKVMVLSRVYTVPFCL